MTIKNKQIVELYNKTKAMDIDEYIQYYKVLGDKVRHLVCKEIFTHPGITGKEILVKFHVSQPTLSFHIAQLIKAKIIIDKKDGQSHRYYPNYERIISFHKTTAKNHMEIESFVGKIYKKIIEDISKK